MVNDFIKQKISQIGDLDLSKYKLIGYCRVSSDEQKKSGTSIEQQSNIHKQFGITEIYSDEGKSASMNDELLYTSFKYGKMSVSFDMKKRPSFTSILELAETQKLIIFITYWDRISRNLALLESLMIHLGKRDCYVVPYFDSAETAMRQMNGIMAQIYIDNQRKKMNQTWTYKFERGMYIGKNRKFGFTWTTINEFKTLIPSNDNETKIVKDVFKMALELPYSNQFINKISKKFNLQYATVRDMLKDPYYCGIVSYNGQYKKGVHDGIVPYDVFMKVQHKMGNIELVNIISDFHS